MGEHIRQASAVKPARRFRFGVTGTCVRWATERMYKMSRPIEDGRITRRDLLKGAAGVAGSLAVGSLAGPDLAKAIPRRRLAPTKVVVMSQELTAGARKAGTPSIKNFEDD